MSAIVARLVETLGEEMVVSGAALAALRAGWPVPQPISALALLRPRTTEQVADALRLCSALGQPIVPYGGLTNLVRATRTDPAEVALSLERMNAIEEVDPVSRTLTVQAGATLRAVQEAAAAADLMVALDFGARDYCTIGGNVATNAGGGRVLRYGMMREQVLGLEVVLADGSVLSSLNRMLKNNTGYDLKHYFIGSEGTLGVITRLVLRLYEPPAAVMTALVALDRFDQVVALLKLAERVFSGRLSSYEVMWQEYYRTIVPALAIDPAPLPHGHDYYVLLEAAIGAEEQIGVAFDQLLEQARARRLVGAATVARSQQERELFWSIRYGSEQIDYRYAPIFNFDVSLPIAAMESYVGEVRRSLAALGGPVECWVFGHIADGNLHLMVWSGDASPSARQRIEEQIYLPLQRYGGSISAEHGIGLEKQDYLHLSRSAVEIELMRRIKATLDPQNILNPGKLLPPKEGAAES